MEKIIVWSIGIILMLGIINFLVVEYWYIILPLVVVGLVIHFMHKAAEEEKDRKAAEAKRKAKQQEYRKQMIVLGEQSIDLFESMPNHLDSAEQWLDQAEADFMKRAFTPFWDSIENAATCLACFDEGVRHIKNASSRYTQFVGKCEDTPPRFPLARESVEKLNVGAGTAKRMEVIVRKAQCDFQFASIYGQYKTNQILVSGFQNLAQVLEQMTWQITASLDDLAGSVNVMTSTLNESTRAIHSRMGDIVEMTSKYNMEQAARERKALEMLDNIQRKRKPL